MRVLYLTSAEAGDGRTVFCAGLATAWAAAGKRVALLKPISLGNGAGPDPDAQFFTALARSAAPGIAAGPEPVHAPEEQASHGLDAVRRGQGRRLARTAAELGQAADVVVEGTPCLGSSGLPLQVGGELAQVLDANVVAVLRYTPQLSPQVADTLRSLFGKRLAGVVVNRVPRHRGHDARTHLTPQLEAQGIPVLGVVPEDRSLLAPTLGQVASHLGGQFYVGEEETERLVERFIIGAPVLDWGINYFGRYSNQAVIVRGDRPDVQMAALGTPQCSLILTGGHAPNQYVLREAEQQGVPLLVVDQDTLQAATALDALGQSVTAHHTAKAKRAADLVAHHVDLAPLAKPLGL